MRINNKTSLLTVQLAMKLWQLRCNQIPKIQARGARWEIQPNSRPKQEEEKKYCTNAKEKEMQ